MSPKKNLKKRITEAVMAQLVDKQPNEDVSHYINIWWYTKSGDGLRLTHTGDVSFRLAEIEFFDLPLSVKHVTWYSFLVNCNNKLKCPYFIGVNKKELDSATNTYIRLYDSKIAMLVQLYGDIQSYLESVRTRK